MLSPRGGSFAASGTGLSSAEKAKRAAARAAKRAPAAAGKQRKSGGGHRGPKPSKGGFVFVPVQPFDGASTQLLSPRK